MEFYDTHMHSCLSFDCDELPEAYVDDKTSTLIFTDHFDLKNPWDHGQDSIPDFTQLFKWQEDFKKKEIEMLTGVEIGYVPGKAKEIQHILSPYHFDVAILSAHQNTKYDYMDVDTGKSADEMINEYLDQLSEALDYLKDCQIFAHFDYGFRVHPLAKEAMAKYEEKIKTIFSKVIDLEMAFELNSKSIVKYNKIDLYRWAIPIYQAMGGKYFSLGSDAHKKEEKFNEFDTLIDLLEEYNVKEVCVYKNKERFLCPLADVRKVLKR